jgi:serine/threonine protein kinase, bacterial
MTCSSCGVDFADPSLPCPSCSVSRGGHAGGGNTTFTFNIPTSISQAPPASQTLTPPTTIFQSAATMPPVAVATSSPSKRNGPGMVVGAALVFVAVVAALAIRSNTRNRALTKTVATTSPSVSTAHSAPPQTTRQTTPPTSGAPTTQASATVAPTTRAPSTAAANELSGDLRLSQRISKPECDGQFIIILASIIGPDGYAPQTDRALKKFAGALYLRTDQTCPSLRPSVDGVNPIYSVYFGPYRTKDLACQDRNAVGGDAYVKVLDRSTPFSVIIGCDV